jgi:hypothetical protein
MRDITIVTGPARSGTSSVTGLLEGCGFNLGRNVRILREQSADNPRGDLEPDLLLAINYRLLAEARSERPGELPNEEALAALAAQRENYFQIFIRKFDGDLIKDPMLCLVLPLWEQRWDELRNVIYCLRHPLEVARSCEKRYGQTAEQGLELWNIFTRRFFASSKRRRVFVFDFNAFLNSPFDNFVPLLEWLGRSMPGAEVQRRLDEILGPRHIHWSCDETDLQKLPVHVRELYLKVRAQVGPLA